MMTSKSDVKLLNFFIFNPTFYRHEGEEDKKIIYYYPPKTDQDTQLKNAGLCEALIKFTMSFNPVQPCQSFYTEKTRQLFLQPEENYWMVMTIGLPYVVKGTDENKTTEYQSDHVQDNVFSSILQQCYKMFRLFNGTFSTILNNSVDESSISDLKQCLEKFYNQYIPTLKLGHCDILDVFQGILFLPLGRDPFLHVQCFINLVETTFKCIRYTVFLYNDQLVWSGIEPEDMQVIYQYLINNLLPLHLDLELQGASFPRGPNTSTIHHYGSFVTGPDNQQDSIVSTKKVPKVFIQNDSKPETFHLIVYRALSATLCLFVNENDSLSLKLFKDLDSYLGPRLTSLVSEVAEHCVRQSTTAQNEAAPKYVYYNKLNLAQKSTVHLDSRKNGNICVSPDILRLMADVNADRASTCVSGEVVIKALNDHWLVSKFSNSREFYVIISQKKANLIEISEEVKKLCDNQLKGIFFLE